MKKLLILIILTFFVHQIFFVFCGERGQGARFLDPADDTVSFEDESIFDILDVPYAFTIAFWIVSSTQTGGRYQIIKQNSGIFFAVWIKPTEATPELLIRMRDDAADGIITMCASADLAPDLGFFSKENPDQWVHCAIVHKEGGNAYDDFTFYVNGKNVAATDDGSVGTVTTVATNTPLELSMYSHAKAAMAFVMDELYVFNYKLTQPAIETLMNQGIPGESPGLVASYHFDEKSGDIFNSAGSGATGRCDGTSSVNGYSGKGVTGE